MTFLTCPGDVQGKGSRGSMTLQIAKALTIRNPLAVPVTWGYAPVENRTWHTSFRGPIAIHAGSRRQAWSDDAADNPLVQAAWAELCEKTDARVPFIGGRTIRPPLVKGLDHPLMPFQAITAVADLTGCHYADQCARPGAAGTVAHCSAWARPGEWHFALENVRRLDTPIPHGGRMNLWPVPDGLAAAVAAGLGGAG